MNRVLVIYGTKTGCTRDIAERIGERLRRDGATAEVFSAGEAPTPEGFDAVVVGSGIRMSQWHEPVRTWVSANAEVLREMPVASYTSCLTVVSEPEKAEEMRAWSKVVEDAAGIAVVDSGLFAGWFEPKQFGFLERTILKGMKAPQGDFRDFDAVDSWTNSVAPKLGISSVKTPTV
jgi:menaquinone-dependent protoporphyrinogen oxidase